ncbi:MAG: fluoride efflux transporter CrcB [Betaproteobacteria bacterium]|jgi:CrcB protein|nr:fluoride efflux transporter CrcB [Betaproteobacteria bacterium]MBP6647021.1 fluoride efflux transporter CrcB [Burkholderiaceae bacterium]
MIAIFAISFGAALGALARWGLSLWLNANALAPPLMPWGTLAANLIGGYLIGIVVAVLQGMPQLDPAWRLAIVTGFLGGLTTFSSFSAEVVSMLQQERYTVAIGTVLAHVMGSLVLTVAGMRTVGYWMR